VLHEQARAIFEETGNRGSQAKACGNIGTCYEALGKYDEGVRLLEEARAMLQEVGDRANEAIMLIVLGRCKTALGEYAHAITCHNQRWALVQELHLMNEQASTALELGVVTWAKARVEHRDAARGASLGHSGGAAFLFASPTAGGVGQLDGPAPAAPVFTFAAASGIRRPKAYMDSMHDAA